MFYLINEDKEVMAYNVDREEMLRNAYFHFGTGIQSATILKSVGSVDIRPVVVKPEVDESPSTDEESEFLGVRMARASSSYYKPTQSELDKCKFHIMVDERHGECGFWLPNSNVTSSTEEKDSVDVFSFQVCKHCLNKTEKSFELNDTSVTR